MKVFKVFFAIGLLFYLGTTCWGNELRTIIKDGKALAVIVIPGQENCIPEGMMGMKRRKIADKLAELIELCTSVKLPIMRHMPEDSRFGIVLLTRPKYADSYDISFPDARRIVLTGDSLRGLEYAVYDFAERYLGMGFLFPGEHGIYAPKNNTVTIPAVPVREVPAFETRNLGGGRQGEVTRKFYEWALCNRGGFPKVQFSHRMYSLVPPQKYARSNPEFYPIRKGKRFIPGQDGDIRLYWQPCFTAAGLAEKVASDIEDRLKKNPALRTVSLGINDGGGHCECENCRKLDDIATNNHTISFLNFADQVARRVNRTYPYCRFGFLAYVSTAKAPETGEYASTLVPFICRDRMQYLDPVKRQADQKNHLQWLKKFPEMGWYDYVYGKVYQLPRIYQTVMTDYIRWGHRHGVKHYYAEYYPAADYHDIVKCYLLLKLLWNPSADPEKIMDRYYQMAVGEKAAPHLKAYFKQLEKFWTVDVPKTPWFSPMRNHLDRNNPGWMEPLTEKFVVDCENHLLRVKELSNHAGRGEYFLKTFRERKHSFLAYIRNAQLRKAAHRMKFEKEIVRETFDTPKSIWENWKRLNSKDGFHYVTVDGKSGGVLKIDGTMCGLSGALCFLKKFSLKPGYGYQVSVQCKISGIRVEANTGITLRWRDSEGRWLDSGYTVRKKISGITDSDWKKLTVYVTPPVSGKGEMQVMLGISGTDRGCVLFDDFTIRAARLP